MGIISISSRWILFPNRLVRLIANLFLAIHHRPVHNRVIQGRLRCQIVLGIMLLDRAVL